MDTLEKLYQKVKSSGYRRDKLENVDLGHGSFRGTESHSFFKLKMGRYVINASIERYEGSSLAGYDKGIIRRLIIRTTYQIFSAESRKMKSDWHIKRGKIPTTISKNI